MRPVEIKHALENLGFSQADVARSLVIKRSTVCAVIHSTGRSEKVERRISEILGKSLTEIWPHWYAAAKTKRRQSTGELYAQIEQLKRQVARAA